MSELREYHLAQACESRGLGKVIACRHALVGQCQYCGRGFCERHGDRFGENEEVCGRKACQAKKRDVVAHTEYRQRALARNAGGECGYPQCDRDPVEPCKRCSARHCLDHLRRHLQTRQDRGELADGLIILCTHCLERVPTWQRM